MDNPKGAILVIDDDHTVRSLLVETLSSHGHSVSAFSSGKEALAASGPSDLVIADLHLPEMEGFDLMDRIREVYPDVPVIVVTAPATVGSAIEAVRRGAYDYVEKPFKIDELLLMVEGALRESRLRSEVARLRGEVGERGPVGKLIGKSKEMQEVFDLIQRISGTGSNVLVVGESGTGKEVVARAIHSTGSRRKGPFVPVNCAAIPETLLESELFGYARGAFTDAKGDRAGLFEAAVGGTLFLDEISEIPVSLQAKLLRVLEDKEVRRLGSTRTIKVDVRVIAASNQDLDEAVRQHRFRDDLYYRLNVIQIRIPPLREHRGDILLLAGHFLSKFRQETGKNVTRISEAALALMLDYPWPGNVRELENAVERGVILARGNEIVPGDLPSTLAGRREDYSALEDALDRRLTLDELERKYIDRILAAADGNKYRAAQILGIDRKTLYRKLKRTKHEAAPDPNP